MSGVTAKTKVITPANPNKYTLSNEPIRTSTSFPGEGKKRDPGNEVVRTRSKNM